MKNILLSLAIVAVTIGSVSAQTYKADYATKLVLAGNMTDPANTLTIKAPVLGGAWSLSLPTAAAGTNGFVLTGNTDGTTQWTNIFGGSLAGSFTTLTSTGSSTIGTSNTALANSFGTGANANNVINTIGSTGSGSMTTINGGVTISGLTAQPGVVHNNGSGVLSSGPVTNTDLGVGAVDLAGTDILSTSKLPLANGGTAVDNTSIAQGAFFAGPSASAGSASFRTITAADIATALNTAGNAGTFTTLTSTGNSTLGTSSSALANSFGTGGNAANVINTIGSTGGGTSMTTINGAVTLGALGTGVVHTVAGLVSTGLIVNGDITDGTIKNAKLENSTIAIGSTGSSLTVTGSPIAIGGTAGNVEINVAHDNDWTGKQTITGANKFMYVDGNEGLGNILVSDGNGNASWSAASSVGVTTATGTSPISVNGDNSAHSGAVTISITHADLTVNGTGLGVTGGTGAVIGSGAEISLTTGALTGGGALAFTGGGVVVGSATSLALTTDATLTQAGNSLGIDLTHDNTWTGQQSFGAVTYTSTAPAAIAATTPDWALSTSNSYFKISSTGNQTVSGIDGGVDGRVIVLVNTGTDYINFTNLDAGSAAENQFKMQGGDNVLLGPNGNISFVYDGTAAKWRMLYAN